MNVGQRVFITGINNRGQTGTIIAKRGPLAMRGKFGVQLDRTGEVIYISNVKKLKAKFDPARTK